MKILFFFFFLQGCGSYLVIDSTEYRVPVKMGRPDIREQTIRVEETSIGRYEDLQKNLYIKEKKWTFFQRPNEIKVNEKFAKINVEKIPIKNLVITTYFSFWDNLLALIPFVVPRTILFEGEYGQWSVKRIREDDFSDKNNEKQLEEGILK